MESTYRPLGGIAALTLGVASQSEAALTLPQTGVEITLLEDRSTYTESIEWVGSSKSVKHTLRVVTWAEYELPDTLVAALTHGFVALVTLNSGATHCVGWSEYAAGDRPLRLVSCSVGSGEKPASRGCKEWLFESVDSGV